MTTIINNAINNTLPSLTFTPTTSGIIGVTDASTASTGVVGEILSSGYQTVSMGNSVYANIASLSITAGDWNVWGLFQTTPGGATTTSFVTCGISTVTDTLPTPSSVDTSAVFQAATAFQTGVGVFANTGILPVNISGTNTYFLVGAATFAVSTLSMSGVLFARRIR